MIKCTKSLYVMSIKDGNIIVTIYFPHSYDNFAHLPFPGICLNIMILWCFRKNKLYLFLYLFLAISPSCPTITATQKYCSDTLTKGFFFRWISSIIWFNLYGGSYDFLWYSIHFRVTWDPLCSSFQENVYGIMPNTYEIIQSIISLAMRL